MALIPVSSPSMGPEELAGIQTVLQSRWLGLGAVTKQFEDETAKFLDPSGATQVVAVNTGTTALHLALETIGVKAGDEVILPSLTFAATAQVVTALGAIPVFCDVQNDTLNLDPADLERCFSSRTRAVMLVHYRGQACSMETIEKLCKARGVRMIEDAAHAFGSRYKNKKIGSFGDLTCFSFDPIKNITCGEGGAITTRDQTLAERLRHKRILGIDRDTWSRQQKTRPWSYDVVEQGFRYHMPNLNAAIGLAQLKKFPAMQDRKNHIASVYDQAFKILRGVRCISTNYQETAIFTYMIRVINKKRDALMTFLKEVGIDSGVHYIPVHHFSYFKHFAQRALPVTDLLFEEILTLPLYTDMTDAQVELIVNTVKQWTHGPS